MKQLAKLNPEDVSIFDNPSAESIILKKNEKEDKYSKLKDVSDDNFNSFDIIKNCYNVHLDKSTDQDITIGVILFEIKRLFIRAVSASNSNIDTLGLLSNHTVECAFTLVERSILSIIASGIDTHDYYRSAIISNVFSLLDILQVSFEIKESYKIKLFIDCFVDAFTGKYKIAD